MPKLLRTVIVRHWWPIVTFCPFNGMPDFLWVSVQMLTVSPDYYSTAREEVIDLRIIRRKVRAAIGWKKISMEDACRKAAQALPGMFVQMVVVRMLASRHVVAFAPATGNGFEREIFASGELLG